MKLCELPFAELRRRLVAGDLLLDIHPFTTRLRSRLPALARELAMLYAEFPLLEPDSFADFHIEIRRERAWWRPQARFLYDGRQAFQPLPASHAVTMVEWGLNWCVASHAHQYLIIHAAVLERDGRALLMPAPPGSGKSTLCAALMLRGWRLLSDELALLDRDTGLVQGMARPVNLKNASIDLIQRFEPSVRVSTPVPDTQKGLVALVRPPDAAVARREQPARVCWVVLPRWRAGVAPRLKPMERARALVLMAEQSFNYGVLGREGFEALASLCEGAQCHEFEYSALDEGVSAMNALAEAS